MLSLLVFLLSIKLDDGCQTGPILYHVKCFVQWKRAKINWRVAITKHHTSREVACTRTKWQKNASFRRKVRFGNALTDFPWSRGCQYNKTDNYTTQSRLTQIDSSRSHNRGWLLIADSTCTPCWLDLTRFRGIIAKYILQFTWRTLHDAIRI